MRTKRINILSLIAITTVMVSLSPSLAFDKNKEGIGSNKACFYRKHGVGTYIFCGTHHRGDKCGPKSRTYNPSFDKQESYGHGQAKNMPDGQKYWCCTNDSLRWVQDGGDFVKSVVVSAPTQKANSDGTMSVCVTTTKQTVCGETVSETCHNCPATTPFWRNGECTVFCGQTDFTMAFDGIASNECISCPTTSHQGIAEIDAYGCNWGAGQKWDSSTNTCTDKTDADTEPTSLLFNVCLKCNPATQFFDTKTKSCVLKSSREQKNKMELKQCWMALSSRVYECCLKHGSAQLDEYLKLSREAQEDKISINPLECCVNGGSWSNNSCNVDRISDTASGSATSAANNGLISAHTHLVIPAYRAPQNLFKFCG